MSPVDIVLNVVFATWVLYFLATGHVVPSPLLRSAPETKVIEVQPAEELPPVLSPIEFPEDS